VVKKLGLNTKMHHNPYSLNWIRKYHKFPITKQCIIKFSITSKYVDEVFGYLLYSLHEYVSGAQGFGGNAPEKKNSASGPHYI
jgi:hypothetical protein